MLLRPLYHYCAQWPLYLCLQWEKKNNDPYHLYLVRIVLVIYCSWHNLNSPSEFFSASEGKTPFSLLIAAATVRWHSQMCFQKLFAVSSSQPHLRSRSGATAKKRRQPRWQLPLFKASLMARQILLTPPPPPPPPGDTDWGKMRILTVTAGYGGPASCSSYAVRPKSLRVLSLGSVLIFMSPRLSRSCLCVASSWMMIVSSAAKASWAEDGVSSHSCLLATLPGIFHYWRGRGEISHN